MLDLDFTFPELEKMPKKLWYEKNQVNKCSKCKRNVKILVGCNHCGILVCNDCVSKCYICNDIVCCDNCYEI